MIRSKHQEIMNKKWRLQIAISLPYLLPFALIVILFLNFAGTGFCQHWARTYGTSDIDNANAITMAQDGGYVIAGFTNYWGILKEDIRVMKINTSGDIQWQKTYAHGTSDRSYDIKLTSDGGYILAGDTYINGHYRYLLMKLNSAGTMQWQKSYFINNIDCNAKAIRLTSDGNYLLAGDTSAGIWIIKVDQSGTILWQKMYDRTNGESFGSIAITSDNGYILSTYGYNPDNSSHDIFIIKLDSSGNIQWQKSFGDAWDDKIYSIQETSEGGYIGTGVGELYRILVLKLDSSGNMQWQKDYHDSSYTSNYAADIKIATDGGYIIAGANGFTVMKIDATGSIQWYKSYDYDWSSIARSILLANDNGYVIAGIKLNDIYVIKTKANGDISEACDFSADPSIMSTDTSLSEMESDLVSSVTNGMAETVTITSTDSVFTSNELCENTGTNIDVVPHPVNYGNINASASAQIFVKVMNTGTGNLSISDIINPQVPFTILSEDCSNQTIPPDSFCTIGIQFSPPAANSYADELIINSDDVTAPHYNLDLTGTGVAVLSWARLYGESSYWGEQASAVLEIAEGGYIMGVTTYNNNRMTLRKIDVLGNVQWQKSYADSNYNYLNSIKETSDHGFILAGSTQSGSNNTYDYWVIKTNYAGTAEWQKRFGFSNDDKATSAAETSDGGYLVAGSSNPDGTPYKLPLIMKLNSAGNELWEEIICCLDIIDNPAMSITADGGFVIAANAVNPDTSSINAWIIKFDSTASIQWQKMYGGTQNDYAYWIEQTTDNGFIVAGSSSSFGAGNEDYWVFKLDASGSMQWQKTYGSSGNDVATSIQQTTDGGYIVGGNTTSFMSDNNQNFWVIKIDSSGNAQWQKLYTLNSVDFLTSIRQVTDGGYIAAGYRYYDEDYGRLSLVLKLNSTGYIDASCSFIQATAIEGIPSLAVTFDTSREVQQIAMPVFTTYDTGYPGTESAAELCSGNVNNIDVVPNPINFEYVPPGYSRVHTVDVTNGGLNDLTINNVSTPAPPFSLVNDHCTNIILPPLGSCTIDVQLIPPGTGEFTSSLIITSTDPQTPQYELFMNGKSVFSQYWARTYGTNDEEIANAIDPTKDGGAIVAGYTRSYLTNNSDALVIKFDTAGNIQWQNTYGGPSYGYSIKQTSDGGYILAGMNMLNASGYSDAWILKLDSNGNVQWQKSYGGTGQDSAYAVEQTSDGGYIAAGSTESSASSLYAWVFKLDRTGILQWQRAYGISGYSQAFAIHPSSDGGYLVAGYYYYDDSENMWVSKLNSDGNIVWQKIFSSEGESAAYAIQETKDGNIVFAGHSDFMGPDGRDFIIMKLDHDGNTIWKKSMGEGYYGDYAYSLAITFDNNIAIAGSKNSQGWIMKFDQAGSVIWQKILAGPAGNQILAIAESNNGSIIASGMINTNSLDINVLKLDTNGNIGPSCALLTDTNEIPETITALPSTPPLASTIPATTMMTTSGITQDHDCTIYDLCQEGTIYLEPYLNQKPVIDDSSGSTANGIIEENESVVLRGHVQNIGTADALSTYGQLSSNSPIYIPDAFAYYGDIQPAHDAICNDCYRILAPSSGRPQLHWDFTVTETLSAYQFGPVFFNYAYHVGNSFSDVPPSYIFYRYIEILLHSKITSGSTATEYSPDLSVQRQQMAKFICRSMELISPGSCPSDPICHNIFIDVPPSNIFCTNIEALLSAGIVSGCQSNPLSYCPLAITSRQQMAKLICMAMSAVNPGSCVTTSCTGIFTDVLPSNPFCSYIEALYNSGIISGCSSNTYCPNDPVLRGQMAKFLVNSFGFIL